MYLYDIMDINELDRLIKENYISASPHEEFPLTIYNYTNSAQYDKVWTPETLQCRGLITDDTYKIISRPFPKFFNTFEYEHQGVQLADDIVSIQEKLDGMLGVSYHYHGQMWIASRGRFHSDAARVGTSLIDKSLPYQPHLTYCFEIIHPRTKIICNYGDRQELVLLAIRDAEGHDEELTDWPGPKAKEIMGNLEDLEIPDGEEGYVIRYADNIRAKIKGDAYMHLVRMSRGLSKKRILEGLIEGKTYDHVPEEFEQEVKQSVNQYKYLFNTIYLLAKRTFLPLKNQERKDFAKSIQHQPYRDVLFRMYDDEDVENAVWKAVKKHAM